MASGGVPSRGGTQLATMKLNDSKAGMEGLDTDRINQIIEEASRGSKFYNHKKQRQEKIDERIKRMLELKDSFTPEQLARAEAQMDLLAAQLEASRDLSRFIVHVDMDAFYAAVEMRDRPELRDVPMAVGGMGMLSTSNYAARKFGVRAAMPGFIGRKLCPQLVIIPCNFEKYRAASEIVQGVLARYDPNFSMASLDEGYLDITEKVVSVMSASGGDSEETEDEVAQTLVQQLRAEICRETLLTASAGIACNGMLAKICSDRNKPDGQFFLPRERPAVLDFLRDLPVRKVSGIGNVLSQQLAALGVTSCGHLLQRRALLRLLLSETAQGFLLSAGLGARDPAHGRDDEDRHQKSVSTETTFAATADAARLTELLRDLCAQLAEDLRRKRLRGRTVTLKVKTSSFVVRSRAASLAEPTAAAETLLAVTRPALARELAAGEPLRLLGVRASALVPAEETAGRRQATLAEMVGRGAAAAQQRCPVCGRTGTSLAELSEHVDRCLAGEAGAAEDAVDSPGGDAWVTGEDCVPAENGGQQPSHCSDADTGPIAAQGCAGSDAGPQPLLSECNTDDESPGAPPAGSGDGRPRVTSVDSGGDASSLRAPPAGSDGDSLQGDAFRGTDTAADTVADTAADTADTVADTAAGRSAAAAVCPVCAKPLPGELQLVNRHLDECLNQQLLSELTDGGPSPVTVRGLKRPGGPQVVPSSKHKRIDTFFQVKK